MYMDMNKRRKVRNNFNATIENDINASKANYKGSDKHKIRKYISDTIR